MPFDQFLDSVEHSVKSFVSDRDSIIDEAGQDGLGQILGGVIQGLTEGMVDLSKSTDKTYLLYSDGSGSFTTKVLDRGVFAGEIAWEMTASSLVIQMDELTKKFERVDDKWVMMGRVGNLKVTTTLEEVK